MRTPPTSAAASPVSTCAPGPFARLGAASGQGIGGVEVTGGDVFETASDGAGGFFIDGSVTSVSGVPRNRIAHVLADGSVDPAFDPDANGP